MEECTVDDGVTVLLILLLFDPLLSLFLLLGNILSLFGLVLLILFNFRDIKFVKFVLDSLSLKSFQKLLGEILPISLVFFVVSAHALAPIPN